MESTAADWQIVNQRVMARTLAECAWEGLLNPVSEEKIRQGTNRFRLDTGAHTFQFEARRTPWDYLWIHPESIRRNGYPFHDAIQLVLDCRDAFAMSDITLGNFIEELNNTLAGDLLRQQEMAGIDAAQLLDLPAIRLEGLLDGHPKVLANRGRLGWGQDDLHRYSPEAGQPVRLRWVAVHRATGIRTFGTPAPEQCLTGEECRQLASYLDSPDWQLLPVHPWQWQQFIQPQYAALLQAGTLVDLGELGEAYLPQQSIRTLSNAEKPGRCDLKLALTILNTSCYRGIPPEPMAWAPELSRWLSDLARQDPLLAEKGLTVQQELGGLHLPHPHQQQVQGTPYRYREMLGAVWRESLASKLSEGEQGWIFAVLMQCDGVDEPLVAEIIRRSGWPVERWLKQLFERVTLPLYHLLCRYGVGLVAHGQNLGVIFRHYRPERVVIKDFHGDLRVEDGGAPVRAGLPKELAEQLPGLPAAHLLHDLYTGHLVTGLRFLSPLLEDRLGLPETRFYQLLYQCLHRYQREHPELARAFARFDLLRPAMERVCLNRVRFRIGYGDDAARPTPALGPELANPLSPLHHTVLEPTHE